jgi:hypothetical protein
MLNDVRAFPCPDYHKAIKNRDLAFILWLVAIAAGFVINPLIEVFLWHGV